MQKIISRWLKAIPVFVYLAVFISGVARARAQQAVSSQDQGSGSVQGAGQVAIQGTVVDQRGQGVRGASVTVRSASGGQTRKAVTNSEGVFSVSGLADGNYTVQVTAPGFATGISENVRVAGGSAASVSIPLAVASVTDEVTVEAEADTTLAAQLAPVKALLDAGSARSEISNIAIRDFTSPVTDFTEIMQAAPGTFSVSPDGVGLGQSNTSFRGFIDGDFTITYDGIPFNDTNNPTHHSWAFFPGPTIGGVDFDRSPGTASDMGPANYGGSIHLLSPTLPSGQLFRISDAYGSYNTNLIDGQYNSGLFWGKNPKANLWFDGQHLTTDGYETQNDEQQTAGAVKFIYKFSDRTYLTADGNYVLLDANNSGNAPLREQLAEFGNNYYLDKTQFLSDGATIDAQWYRMYFYHVPTNFEYVDLSTELGHGWRIDSKPYTYAYSNHEHYNNSTQDSSIPDTFATNYYNDGTTHYYQTISSTSGIDKMNQYVHAGEILTVSAASKYGVFRTGLWYEYAGTNRYQIESNPLTWVDVTALSGIKFHENFWTNSVQPYAEYQLVAIPKWTITAGIKDAYYNMSLKQYADGKIVGNLCPTPTSTNCPAFVTNDAGYNSRLPSVEANYRINTIWSAYVQYGKGSIIPPSSVFDENETPTAKNPNVGVSVTPPPQVASTWQIGSVLKLDRVSADADAYRIHFDNSYIASPVADSYTYNATPPSDTLGFEAEGNIALGHGISVPLNFTMDDAYYEAQAATATTPASVKLLVAGAPRNTESEGVTYQNGSWDAGFFNKRVGFQWNDNTDANGNLLHQAIPIQPFTVTNVFLNYTVHHGSRFDDSKLRFSVNNLFNNNNVVGVTAFNTGTAAIPFVANGGDMMTTVPGRAVMVSFQLGFGPKQR